MPRQMNVYEPMEIIVKPDTTYLLIEHIHDSRRIYTDGRDWPEEMEPVFSGYSIGKWIDEDGDGRFDLLVVERRGRCLHGRLESKARAPYAVCTAYRGICGTEAPGR
jgi:hypothetical protein